MRKTILVLCVCCMVLLLCSCKTPGDTWRDQVNAIEAGMSYDELVALMGEPDADIASGGVTLMYILSDTYVALVSMKKQYSQEDGVTLCVAVEPALMTFEEFKEMEGCYPNDPTAWWADNWVVD